MITMNTTVTLGKTGITVSKNGFGALPIQRISTEEAGKLLKKAYDGGIRFFDTARFYTDGEPNRGSRCRRVLEGFKHQPDAAENRLH